MNAAERGVRRVDRFQQRHAVLAFPFAVVQKFGNDRAGALATRIAYHGLFSLFPLLLLFTTILGFALDGHPDVRNTILDSAVANFPIIGTQIKANTHPLTGNGLALAIGIGGTIYGGFGVGQAAQAAMNGVWNIPYVEWPNFFLRRLRALLVVSVFGLSFLASAALTILASHAGLGGLERPLALIGSTLIAFAVFLAAFIVLTAEPLEWRDVALGAILAALFWQGLQMLGNWFVARSVKNASDTYGFFTIVIATLSWMYVAAQLTLLAAEINVVRKYQLWPRSITQPPLIDGDRRTFQRMAQMEVRRPEYEITMELNDSADDDPLAEAEAEEPAAEDEREEEGEPRSGQGRTS